MCRGAKQFHRLKIILGDYRIFVILPQFRRRKFCVFAPYWKGYPEQSYPAEKGTEIGIEFVFFSHFEPVTEFCSHFCGARQGIPEFFVARRERCGDVFKSFVAEPVSCLCETLVYHKADAVHPALMFLFEIVIRHNVA